MLKLGGQFYIKLVLANTCAFESCFASSWTANDAFNVFLFGKPAMFKATSLRD